MSEKYEMNGVYEVGKENIIKHGDTFCSGFAADDIIREFGTKIEEPVTYRVGDRFLNDCHRGEWRLVGLCDDGMGYGSVALVGESGFAYGNSVPVKNIDAVTQEEFAGLLGQRSHFTKIEDSE